MKLIFPCREKGGLLQRVLQWLFTAGGRGTRRCDTAMEKGDCCRESKNEVSRQSSQLRMNGTPILSETAGYGRAGLRLRYAFAGPDHAVREPRSAKDTRPRPPLLMGCGGREPEPSPEISGRRGRDNIPTDCQPDWRTFSLDRRAGSRRRWTTPATELRVQLD